MKESKIICIGNFGWDLITLGKKTKKAVGGSALRFIQVMALFKLPTLVVSGINIRDKKWSETLTVLKKNNIKFLLKKIDNIPVFKLKYNKDYKLKNFIGENNGEVEKLLEKLVTEINFSDYQLVHLCPLSLKLVKKIIREIKDKKIKTSLQFHFSLLSKGNFNQWLEIFTKIDYLFISVEDLNIAFGIGDFNLKDNIKNISNKVRIALFLTDGSRGADVFSKGKLISQIPAFSLSHIKDPTGVGDIFAGGVIAGLMSFKNITASARLGMILTPLKLMGYLDKSIILRK